MRDTVPGPNSQVQYAFCTLIQDIIMPAADDTGIIILQI